MTEQDRAKKQATELRPEELNSVTGGAGAAKPAPKPGAPATHKDGLFEIEDFSFDIEQNTGS